MARPPSRIAPPIPPTTPPTIFLEDAERPELPGLPLLPLNPGAPDDEAADAAATTLLVVLAMLRVLLPLTETTVVTTCWVTLPVRWDEVVGMDDVCVDESDAVKDLESAEPCESDEVPVTEAWVDWVESCDEVDAVLDGELVPVGTVGCAFADDVTDTVLGIMDVVGETATEVADVVAEGLAEAPVPAGTFWR